MTGVTKQHSEMWRPRVHFTPESNWMNDPNGLFYFDGNYHLFYQYNPTGSQWGNMHWGHATSNDLVHWQHHPVALFADPGGLGYIFSGSAIVDHHNITGLQSGDTPVVLAYFTHHSASDHQVQSLAYSLDGGYQWQLYPQNPIITNPGVKDFRDPKVFLHKGSGRWIMLIAAGQYIKIYSSQDLINWEFESDFGEDDGAHGGEWECPDLFELPLADGKSRWVLLVSINPGGPNAGSATQYFVGDFDGRSFTAEHNDIRWLDYGPDNYAGVSWSNVDNNRRIIISWMSNWNYAAELPTVNWRGAMTIPRELSLITLEQSLYLVNNPVREINQQMKTFNEVSNTGNYQIDLPSENALDIQFSFHETSNRVKLRFENDHGEYVEIKYLAKQKRLIVDRRYSGWNKKQWASVLLEADVYEFNEKIVGRLILDSSSLEVFWQSGATSMTLNLYPTAPFNSLYVMVPDEVVSDFQVATIGVPT